MADVTIRLTVDPETGKKDVIIDYHSDADAMPIEHEEMHKKLVGALAPGSKPSRDGGGSSGGSDGGAEAGKERTPVKN
jgi:hypothetical protein